MAGSGPATRAPSRRGRPPPNATVTATPPRNSAALHRSAPANALLTATRDVRREPPTTLRRRKPAFASLLIPPIMASRASWWRSQAAGRFISLSRSWRRQGRAGQAAIHRGDPVRQAAEVALPHLSLPLNRHSGHGAVLQTARQTAEGRSGPLEHRGDVPVGIASAIAGSPRAEQSDGGDFWPVLRPSGHPLSEFLRHRTQACGDRHRVFGLGPFRQASGLATEAAVSAGDALHLDPPFALATGIPRTGRRRWNPCDGTII